jgi:hypothetical protein
MTARVVSAIPTANKNLAGFGFGAMYPVLAPVLCWYWYPVLLRLSRERCELVHTPLLVQKIMGVLEGQLVTAVTATEAGAWQTGARVATE